MKKIHSASQQVVAGVKYGITAEFETTDSKSVTCDFDIWERVWIPNGRHVKVDCNDAKKYNFKQQPKRRTKRDVLVGAPNFVDVKDEHVNGLLKDHLTRLDTGESGKLE